METLTRSDVFARENDSESSIIQTPKTGQFSHSIREVIHPLNAVPGIVGDKGVECRGFSIREYVGKMRSADIRKCWPFSEGLLEDGLIRGEEDLLTPLDITCKKSCGRRNCAAEQREPTTSTHKSQFHDDPAESSLISADGTKYPQMVVCLSPCSEVDLDLCKDLEEQIRKLSTVQISVLDERKAEDKDVKQFRETKDAGLDVDRNRQSSFGLPFPRAESSNIGTLDCTSESSGEGKPTGRHKREQPQTNDTEIRNRDGKPDTVVCKASLFECPGLSFRSDLTESDCQLFMDVGIRQETEKAKEVARDQILGGSVKKQSERRNIDNLNPQAIEIESVTQSLSNFSNDEGSAVKIRPVRKTFTSATITAANAHIDDCIAPVYEKKKGRLQNHKSRKQKKRSIADIICTVDVSAPNYGHLDDLQKMETIKSDGISALSCNVNKIIGTVKTGSASAISDELPSFKPKRKRASRVNHLVHHGKSGKEAGGAAGSAGSLDTNRKRPRFCVIPSISKGHEELKIPLAASHCTKNDHGAEQYLKHSSIEESFRDFNFEDSQGTKMNQVQNCDFPTNHHQFSCKLVDHINSVSTLPKEERAKKGVIPNYHTQVDESGTLVGANLGDASSCFSIQRFDREKESVMDNVKMIHDTRKETEGGHSRNIQLDLNKRACAFPRDSEGRFLDSHIINGDKDDSLYAQWKDAPKHKSTKPPRSLLYSTVRKKESNNTEAYLYENENAVGNVNLRNNSDNGYIGLPLDLEQELVNPKSYTGQVFNQLYKTSNHTDSENSLVSQGTHQDFNFVESCKTCYDGSLVNQPLQTWGSKDASLEDYSIEFKKPDHEQEYSVSNANQSNPDKVLSEHSSLPDKNKTSKMLCGNASFGIATSISSLDAFSMFAMQSNVQYEYDEDQSQKASLLEKIHPQVDIRKQKQSTAQPVMRLMGKSFTIGGENWFEDSFKHRQQCNTTDTINRSPTRAPTYVSSAKQRMPAYIGCCIACNTGQFDFPCPEGNVLSPHCNVKANTSKSTQHNLKNVHSLDVTQCIASHQCRTLDNNAPKLVERKVSANYVHAHSLKQQSDSGKAWISNPPFSATKANPLISPVKGFCNNPDLNKGQKMKYKDSHANKSDCPVQKQTDIQLLDLCLEKCTFQNQVFNSCSYTSSSCTETDLQTNLVEKSDTFSRTEDMHKRKREIHQEIFPSNIASKHLKRPEKTKNSMLGYMHSEPSRYGGNSSSKVENESEIRLNIPSQAGFSQKHLQKETQSFLIPYKKSTETKASTSQLHCSNAGSSFKFTEAKKSIGGVKHKLKPFSKNGNGKQFLPMHFTLPFAETSAAKRN